MIKRLKTNAGVALGLSALVLGGPAAAMAATGQTTAKPVAVERVPARDGDHIKKGSQATSDSLDRMDAGSRNERARATDRDAHQRAEHTSKDLHGDK